VDKGDGLYEGVSKGLKGIRLLLWLWQWQWQWEGMGSVYCTAKNDDLRDGVLMQSIGIWLPLHDGNRCSGILKTYIVRSSSSSSSIVFIFLACSDNTCVPFETRSHNY